MNINMLEMDAIGPLLNAPLKSLSETRHKRAPKGQKGHSQSCHNPAKCATKRLIKGSREEGRKVKKSTSVNFEQHTVFRETSPISQTPSDQLIVSDEQLRNTQRLADEIEKPDMNPTNPPRRGYWSSPLRAQ